MNVSLEQAINLTLEQCRAVPTETVPLGEAYGCVLAQDVTAARSVPPFDRSPFDGYAFIAADTVNAPVTLKIIGEAEAGSSKEFTVTSGTALKILTGAPAPKGADTIVKFEETEFTAESVTLSRQYSPGNIVPKGEDVLEGTVIARKGEKINPALAGMLAAQGISDVQVYRRPVIGVISTGNELGGDGAGKIFDSNKHSLCAGILALNAKSVFLGSAGDSSDAIRNLITSSECDMYISTGGMGKSDHDFTLSAFTAAGTKTVVHNGAFMPGGTFAFGMLGSAPCFMLSGNPAAAMITFYTLVQPCIRKLSGYANYRNPVLKAVLPKSYNKSSPRTRLLSAILDYASNELTITEHGKGSVSAMNGINAIAVAPKSDSPVPAGAVLEAFLI